ncbi:MAG TPA: Flp pilus assembly protein CpaB [Solimonas sp.]|nr:Flp pilus assembly protein CpaB [Solimonas sp.]
MSSTALKVIAVVSVLLALLLAAVGFQVSRNYAAKADQAEQQQRQQAAQQTLAVVALKPLAAYKPIARDSVALVPVSVKPADPYGSIDDVVDKVPLVDIDAGAPVTQRYFKEGNVLARIIPAGHQAVSVEVSDVVAVGGFVRPGDVVDVLLYLRGGGAGQDQPQSRVLLDSIRVLAYEERIIDRPEGLKDEEDDAKKRSSRTRTAVLAVPEKDTTKLMLGVNLGELRLALHGQGVEVADGGEQGGDAAAQARQVPEKVITIAELSRIRPAPAGTTPGAAPPSRPRVEVFRGSQRETVTTK